MALDIQQIDMTPSFVPYERPPQNLTLWSAIPRGLQSFIIATEQLDVKAVGDEALLELKATLPPKFGYVMMDMQVTIAQNRAFDWSNELLLNIQNFYRAPESLSGALSLNWGSDFPVGGQNLTTRSGRSRGEIPWPTFPIIGQGQTGALINITMFNNVNDATTVGTVNAFIAFWQFDLEQIRKFPINSPIPTHRR